MFEFKTGDILTEEAEALVNTVNCVGIMGRGVALQFKRAFPANFKAYQAACRKGEVQPGRMLVFETGQLTNPHYIVNFPTKRHWRGKSRLSDIKIGLDALAVEIKERRIRSIAVPPLGSGLGGLDWRRVRKEVESRLTGLGDVKVIVYEPQASPDSQPLPRAASPRMTPGRAALIGLINAYLTAHLDPVVTLLEVHKLLYFMQEAGEALRLDFVQAPYGPYAQNLRHVLQAVEGHYTTGYFGADSPTTEIALMPGAVEASLATLQTTPKTQQRLGRVVGLVHGFETPHGLELLASVHWIVRHDHPATPGDVVRLMHAWNPRKSRFTEAQITLALESLGAQGWIEPLQDTPLRT